MPTAFRNIDEFLALADVDAATIASGEALWWNGTKVVGGPVVMSATVLNARVDTVTLGASDDVALVRDDAADALAVRRGTNPQKLYLYNTYTDASNYERVQFGWFGAAAFYLRTQAGGTGTLRGFEMQGQYIQFGDASSVWWQMSTSGHLIAPTDNARDIGQSGATRPRHLYLAGNAVVGGALTIGNTVNVVSPTAPNRTVTIVIGGSTYYLAAKTTND